MRSMGKECYKRSWYIFLIILLILFYILNKVLYKTHYMATTLLTYELNFLCTQKLNGGESFSLLQNVLIFIQLPVKVRTAREKGGMYLHFSFCFKHTDSP
jgi:lipoprotein signal peptidase